MKKFLCLILCAAMLLSIFAGCSKPQNQSGADALEALDPISITIPHGEAGDETNHIHAASMAFKRYVEEQSKGKITVDVAPGGALGDADACMMQVMGGTLEITGSIADGSLSAVYPDFLVYSMPYLFDTEEQALAVYQGDFGKKLWEGFTEKTGAMPLATLSAGFRMTTNSKKEIRSPADFAGLQIRTMNMPAHMEIIKALGATATPIAWTELYSALQTGVVDGQENGIPSIYMGKLYEVQKYLTMDGHVWTTDVWVMNKAWFDKLPLAYQGIITAGGLIMQQVGQRMCAVETDIAMDFLPTVMKVYTPDNNEMQQFKDKTQTVVGEFIRKNVTNAGLVDELLAAAAKAKVDMGYPS